MAVTPPLFLHIIRPEIDLPDDTHLYDDSVYQKAEENFQLFKANGYLVRDEEDSVYVYGIKLGDHLQIGVVAVSHVDDYENDLIKKHEKTRRATEDDRTRHVATLSAHAGPIFLTYRDSVGGRRDRRAGDESKTPCMTSQRPMVFSTPCVEGRKRR